MTIATLRSHHRYHAKRSVLLVEQNARVAMAIGTRHWRAYQCNEAASDIAMDENAIRSVLKEVIDPELGINIVDLGLIDRIVKLDDGIEVALVMTTPACPLGEMLVEQAQQTLANHFPHMASIRVELLRDIPWSPDRMTEAGRRQFGLTADPAPDTMA